MLRTPEKTGTPARRLGSGALRLDALEDRRVGPARGNRALSRGSYGPCEQREIEGIARQPFPGHRHQLDVHRIEGDAIARRREEPRTSRTRTLCSASRPQGTEDLLA